MRDVTESAQDDRKVAIRDEDATGPYAATHWVGQWGGAEALAAPERIDAPAAAGGRNPSAAKASQRSKPSQAARPRYRGRYIALASGVAAVGCLLVVMVPDLDRPDPAQFARGVSAPSRTSDPAPEPSRADLASGQGTPRGTSGTPDAAALPSQDGEQAEFMQQQLSEARRAIEVLTAQLRSQAAKNEHASAQQRDRTATLMQEAEAARKDLNATGAQQRQALEQERAGSAALASQLTAARQDGEALAAQLRKAVGEAGQSRQADADRTAQSLEQDQQKAAALAEAEAARKELIATVAQQRQALEQERARGVALGSQVAAARQDAEALAAQLRKAAGEVALLKQGDIARSAQLLQQEQQKAVVVAEAEAARQALTAATAQHRQALDQERARGAALASQVSAVQRDGEALAAQLRKAGNEIAQLKQAETAKSAQLLQQDQQKAAAFAELEAARQALTTTATQQRLALEQERARGVALANQASTARQDTEALAAQLRKVQDEAAQSGKAAETVVAELRQALQQERDRAAAVAQEPGPARFGVLGPAAAEPVAIAQAPRPEPVIAAVVAEQPAVPEAQIGQEAMRLIARASVLLSQGDIGSARIVLERAAEMGSARASFMLAETYDPRILSAWGTYGTRGEVKRARELYAKAQAGGIQEARERVGALLR